MTRKVVITSDSTTDLGKELIDRFQISILPLGISLGGKSYTDGIDIDADMIYDVYNKTGELPKTAAANINDSIAFFKQFTDQGLELVHFTISSDMSSTYQNSVLAAEELEGVHVVDTRNLSTGGGLLVLAAAEMAEAGEDAETIVAKCEEIRERVSASFVIDNLEFLYKGGRCSSVAMLGANLLKLKPCIVVKDGKMSVAKKYRGDFHKVLLQYIEDQVRDGSGIEKHRIFITHAGCDQEIVDDCISKLKSLADFEEIDVTRAGCTVSSHCGRNTLGVLFIRDSKV